LALQSVRESWDAGLSKSESIIRGKKLVDAKRREVERDVEMNLIYLELNDADTFELVDDEEKKNDWTGKHIILSGALMVGQTRLIDNIIMGVNPASLGILSA
jgi:pantoate--beta-alanine ligase